MGMYFRSGGRPAGLCVVEWAPGPEYVRFSIHHRVHISPEFFIIAQWNGLSKISRTAHILEVVVLPQSA